VGEIVDMVAREGNTRHPEEARPADALDPLAHALEGFGVGRVQLDQGLDRRVVTSGQRGGLLGRKGMASLVNMGSRRAFDTLPPTQIDTPSSGSFKVMDGQTV
jgi:hypothetical protein